MDVLLGPLFNIVITIVELYMWVVIASVILSWLTAFNVINTHNRFVYMIGTVVYRLTEPALRPIRRVLPNLGGLDLSPLVLLLGLVFLKEVLIRLALRVIG
ncbi:YggT family protein [Shumkonia mesophila]|uniref:YggT family protein n=1 Tax=Shumkonia mesophila TaxID=2838854 RepID=UPI00293529E2|nr:YggT family protein [Shumkonia mesophila]